MEMKNSMLKKRKMKAFKRENQGGKKNQIKSFLSTWARAF